MKSFVTISSDTLAPLCLQEMDRLKKRQEQRIRKYVLKQIKDNVEIYQRYLKLSWWGKFWHDFTPPKVLTEEQIIESIECPTLHTISLHNWYGEKSEYRRIKELLSCCKIASEVNVCAEDMHLLTREANIESSPYR